MKKQLKIILIIAVSVCISAAIALVSYAYYTEYSRQQFNADVKINLLFDMLSKQDGENSALSEYQKTLDGYTAYNENAKWGSEQNPFVISDVKYLQNLSTLQNYGYFQKAIDEDSAAIPYFLVCTNKYKPVVIDGSGVTIESIGSDKYPFYGSINGVVGKTEAEQLTVADTGHMADVSAIYNIDVVATNQHDIGLFGTISHTGALPADATATTFSGTPSVVSNLLLVDVKVSSQHSILAELGAWLVGHSFVYSENDTFMDENGNTVNYSRDTHHMGIFAGHIEYATVKNISVYYTSDSVKALDIQSNESGSKSNYYSSTAIIGVMNNVNPKYENGIITVGSGMSDNDLTYKLAAGGGKLSGNKAGYVSAEDVYTAYGYDKVANELALTDRKVMESYDKDGNPLVQEVKMASWKIWIWSFGGATYYYFYDGVFTFALSETPSEDYIKDVWSTENGKMQIPSITYADNNDSAWKYGQLDSLSYIATLTPVTNAADLVGKTAVMCYEGADGKLHLMNVRNSDDVAYGYKADQGKYMINCGSAKTMLKDNYTYLDVGSGYTLQDTSAPGYYLSVKATGNSDASTVAFALQYGNQEDSSTGNQTAETRYTRTWSLAESGRGYTISMNAAYSTSRSWLFWWKGATALKYLSYDESGFVLSDSALSSEKNPVMLCTVDVEFDAFEDDALAPHGYRPADSEQSAMVQDASKYVMYANDEYHYDSTATAAPSVTDNNYTTSNDVNSNYGLKADDKPNNRLSYNLVSLESLGWLSSDGSTPLTSVTKQFSLSKGITVSNVSTGNLNIIQRYSEGVVSAPIGSDGTTTDMPTSTIAFKINQIPEGGAKINVIVSANPNSAAYSNVSFGLWKVDTSSHLFYSTTGFDKGKPMSSFAVPNTRILADGDADEYYKTYVDGNEKRVYLNGDIVLVAHTFVVNEAGTYIMGSTNGPMNICYFSADGVSSSGESQIGSIDFVYSNEQKYILSVNHLDDTDSATEDCSKYYYPSLALIYTDHKKYPTAYMNYEQLFVRRRTDGTDRNIDITVNSDSANEYINASFYSWYSDKCEIINRSP